MESTLLIELREKYYTNAHSTRESMATKREDDDHDSCTEAQDKKFYIVGK